MGDQGDMAIVVPEADVIMTEAAPVLEALKDVVAEPEELSNGNGVSSFDDEVQPIVDDELGASYTAFLRIINFLPTICDSVVLCRVAEISISFSILELTRSSLSERRAFLAIVWSGLLH